MPVPASLAAWLVAAPLCWSLATPGAADPATAASRTGGTQDGLTEVRPASPLDPSEYARHGVRVERPEGADSEARGSLFSWRGNELPLPAPPDRVVVGIFDADALVVLAGGIRQSLDVYIVQASGRIARVATDGGRRLAPSFAAGSGNGSWPVAVGRSVFVVAFEKDGRVELTAAGFDDQRYASRAWPATTTGFRVNATPDRVVITPLGAPAERRVEFANPGAPRLEFVEQGVNFDEARPGERVVREVTLRNLSSQAVAAVLDVDANSAAFEVRPRSVDVPAGGSATVQVAFAPVDDRDQRARLVARRDGGRRNAVILLQGRGAPSEGAAEAGARNGVTSSARPIAPPVASSDTIAASAAPAANGPVGEVSPSGNVAAEPSSPHLTRTNEGVAVRGEPREALVLAVVAVAEVEGRLRPMAPRATYHARLDSAGALLVPLRSLFGELGTGAVVALRTSGARPCQSNLLVID